MTIPLFRPAVHGGEEIEAVSRVLTSGWWGQGPETEAFESEFAAYTGARYAVAVNSGTMALKLAARAAGIVDGLVVCPALTFISTALAMHQLGNRVVFADVNEDTLCVDWDEVLYKFRNASAVRQIGTPMPRAVVPVHFGGTVAGVGPLPGDVKVIEDCAHAAGSFRAGNLGDAACWSFHAVKNLACGDGGMVTTDDEHVAREVRRMRWVGIDKTTYDRDKNTKAGYGWDYDIRALDGEKAHMNDITAAIGRVQLRHLDTDNAVRRVIAATYGSALHDLGWLHTPELKSPSFQLKAQHLYVVRVPAQDRPRFIQHMVSNEVSAGVHYKPLTHYKDNRGDPLFGPQHRLPVTEKVQGTLVTLPLFPAMTEAEVEKVIATVRSFPA